jgi:hypothetical protein
LIRSRFQAWAIITLALSTALLLIAPVWRATLRIGIDSNEGYNSANTARWMSGKALYPAFDALYANNYPPLSFYATGWLGRWLGDYIFAGRLLAFIGLFTSAVAVAAVVKRLTGRIHAALVSGLLLLSYSAAVFSHYVGMDDPQWLGHGIMLLGLLAFLASEQRGWLFLLSAGLMLAAGFVKHILVPIPLAATLWLVLYRREVLALWLATCIALLASALTLCFAIYGSDFFENVFGATRQWSLGVASSRDWLGLVLPLLLLGTLCLPSAWRCAGGRLIGFYAAFSVALAVGVSGDPDLDINAIFDLEIALCLIIGIAIGQFDEKSRLSPVKMVSCGLLLVLILALYLPGRLLEVRRQREHRRAVEADTAEVIDFLAKQPGPVACESVYLCYWAGKSLEIDFFVLGQKVRRGLIDPSMITERLRSRYYTAIQTDAKDGTISQLSVSINQAIEDNYEVARTSTKGAVLTPRRR